MVEHGRVERFLTFGMGYKKVEWINGVVRNYYGMMHAIADDKKEERE